MRVWCTRSGFRNAARHGGLHDLLRLRGAVGVLAGYGRAAGQCCARCGSADAAGGDPGGLAVAGRNGAAAAWAAAMVGARLFPVLRAHLFLDCGPGGHAGEAARLLSGDHDCVDRLGVCADGGGSALVLPGFRCWLLAAGDSHDRELHLRERDRGGADPFRRRGAGPERCRPIPRSGLSSGSSAFRY